MGAIINIILILAAVMTVSGMPRYIIKSLSVNKPTVPVICLPLGTLVSIVTQSKIDFKKLNHWKYVQCFFFNFPVREIEASLLHTELSRQLSKVRKSTNHLLRIWERHLPNKQQYWELRRIRQADQTAERYQLRGAEDQVLEFYSICLHLPTKNNSRNEESLKELIKFQRTNCPTSNVMHYWPVIKKLCHILLCET